MSFSYALCLLFRIHLVRKLTLGVMFIVLTKGRSKPSTVLCWLLWLQQIRTSGWHCRTRYTFSSVWGYDL